MHNYKKEISIDNLLLNKKFIAAGRKERYALTNFFHYMTNRSRDYEYSFAPTPEDEIIGYDGILTIKYKMTGNICGYYLVETKIRERDFDTLQFDKQKLNTLKRNKKSKDKYFKTNYSDHTIGIMYVNHTPSGTYLFDILTILDNKLLPKVTKNLCNKTTVNSREEKVEKDVYMMPKELATKYRYVYCEKEYQLSLLENAQKDFTEATESIKKIISLF